MLTVPTPTLEFDSLAPAIAPREKPLTMTVGPVLRYGVPLEVAEVSLAGLHAFRRFAPGAAMEAWDRDAAAWVPDPSPDLSRLSVDALAFRADATLPWQGLLVPAGGMDAAGSPQFAKGSGGYPSYSFRARFAASDGETGVSAPTPPVSFGSVTDKNLMVLGPGDDEKPESATLARIELKSPALVTIGGLTIRRAAPGAEIVLGNAAGASVIVRPDGSIELRPAPGKGVRVVGDLETEHLVYAPAGGGPKKTLV